MKARIAFAMLLAMAATVSLGNAPTAKALLTKAQAQAKAENKKVWVIFTASWCGWCKKLDAFIADPEMSKLIKKNFVVVHLDVLEGADKKALENEGGIDVMKQLNGENAGLPFSALTDANGKMLINSNRTSTDPKTNIGYPAAPEEIAHYVKMLKAHAPRLTDAERGKIEAWLKAHAPKM
jgi:thiol-disulfide isomerase/thioredoxin